MSRFHRLNRRQWIKATTTGLAGLVAATHLTTFGSTARPVAGPKQLPDPAPKDDRRYIHGFEAYPVTA
jgi:hypothetical protein